MRYALLAAIVIFSAPAFTARVHADTQADAIMQNVAQAVGTYDDLLALGDVKYLYTSRDNSRWVKDISCEQYLFDGEYSLGRYHVHEKFFSHKDQGPIVQGWDGTHAWATFNSQPGDQNTRGLAYYMRKTNFYWFAMMQKLNDPGTQHAYKGTQTVDGIDYHKVELTFDVPQGTVADTYLLYIHPETHRVDRFLFTVVDFGVNDPMLMEVGHQRFGDVVLPVTRRYAPALSWEGNVARNAPWVDEQMTDISFGHGFQPKHFTAEYSAANLK